MTSVWLAALAAIGIGAGLGGIASDIKNLVEGKTPWDDPLEWTKSGLMGVGIGGATGGLLHGAEQAIGPALGSLGESLGIGAGTGTPAVEAGAMTPQAAAGTLSKPAGAILSEATTKAPESLLRQAIGRTVGSTALGAATNPDDPGIGAAMGAASGVATGVFSAGAGALFRGMEPGFWNPGPTKDVAFRMVQPEAPQYSLLRDTLATPRATLATTMRGPELGGQMVGGAARTGGGLAGRAAGMGVGSALTPDPAAPRPNPYEQWGHVPYWARQQ